MNTVLVTWKRKCFVRRDRRGGVFPYQSGFGPKYAGALIFDSCLKLKDRKSRTEHGVPGEMEERLIKVEAVAEASETVMLRLAEGLVFIHLPVAVKVGPSLLIRQNLGEVTGPELSL